MDNSDYNFNIPLSRVGNLISRPLPAATMLTIFSILGISATEGVTDGRFYSTLGLGGVLAVLIWLSSRQDREKSENRIAELSKDYRAMIQEHTSAIGKLTSVIERALSDGIEARQQQRQLHDLFNKLTSSTSENKDAITNLVHKLDAHMKNNGGV